MSMNRNLRSLVEANGATSKIRAAFLAQSKAVNILTTRLREALDAAERWNKASEDDAPNREEIYREAEADYRDALKKYRDAQKSMSNAIDALEK